MFVKTVLCYKLIHFVFKESYFINARLRNTARLIMTTDTILDSTSFSALNKKDKKAVRRLFNAVYQKGKPGLSLDVLTIFRQQHALNASLDYYQKKLVQTNSATFPYLKVEQRQVLEDELLFTFYLLSAKYQLDKAESRYQNLKEYNHQLKHCATLINALRIKSQPKTPETMLKEELDDSEKHLKYLGLTVVGPFAAEKSIEFSGGNTGILKQWMGDINERRLYWVWGGGLLSSVMELIPNDFANKQQAQRVLDAPSPALGYISWILYYARFGIELSLLLKHTFKGPWMSKEEAAIPMWERFKTQWQQRKFQLLNDSVWATVNLVTFFWLTGSGMLGYWGNALTAVLLLVDASLTLWRFSEESTRHNEEMRRLERDLTHLHEQLTAKGIAPQEERLLHRRIMSLTRQKQQREFDWKYKQYGLINDVTYSVGLIITFSVVCCFFFPPAALAPATALLFGVAGAALCFALTLAYTAVSGSLELAKIRNNKQLAKQECEALLERFKASDDSFEKKQLYLDMKQLMADSEHQQRILRFQKINLVRSILIDAMMPALMFSALMFMPMGIGIGVIAAGMALALLSRIVLNRFEPKASGLPEFDEHAYQRFEHNPDLIQLQDKKQPLRFFESKNNTDTALDDDAEHKPKLLSNRNE